MPLTLNSRFAGDIYIIQCDGPIVLGPEASALEAALNAAHTHGFHRFVLSVTGVPRMDSIGLGLIVRFAERLRHRHGDLRLAAPPPFLVNLLSLTGVAQVLKSFPAEDDAIVSFLDQPAPRAPARAAGPRVLFLSDSADLASFVRTVLDRHGFDVRSATLVRDARLLLQCEGADFLLAGPSTAQHLAAARSPADALAALQPIAPKAVPLTLDPGFASLDAARASDALLDLFHSRRSA